LARRRRRRRFIKYHRKQFNLDFLT